MLQKKHYDAKVRYDLEYQKTRTRNISLKFAYGTDEDLIEHLERASQGNIQGYIRNLIRADMENSK